MKSGERMPGGRLSNFELKNLADTSGFYARANSKRALILRCLLTSSGVRREGGTTALSKPAF